MAKYISLVHAVVVLSKEQGIEPLVTAPDISSPYEDLIWNGQTPIEKSILEAKREELQTAENNRQYQYDREFAYPTVKEQLDMMYHDQVNGTTTWKDAIAKVKADNPKS